MKKIVIGLMIIFSIIVGYFTYSYFHNDYEKLISEDEAKKIALEDTKEKNTNLIVSDITLNETVKDTFIYNVEFSSKINYYIYKINAKTKKIISKAIIPISDTDTYLKEEKALEIVFEHALLNQKDCVILTKEIILEDNFPYFYVVFYHNNIRYEYKLNGYTGQIINVTKINEK